MAIRFLQFTLASLMFLFSHSAYAAYYGMNFSFVLTDRVPPLRGYQVMLSYDPDQFKWQNFNIYFDGGFTYFHSEKGYPTVNVYAIAPVVRYSLPRNCFLQPYFEISVGLSYINHTRLEKRNLGIHFAFQDRFGLGAMFGPNQQLSLGIHVVHYSNAHFSSHNSGITVPILFDLGYRL